MKGGDILGNINVDKVQIEIEANSDNAVAGLTRLEKAMERIKAVTANLSGLSKLNSQIKGIAEASNQLNGVSGAAKQIQQMASAINSISTTNSLNSVSKQLTSLAGGVQALSNADFSAAKMQSVSGILNGLANVQKLNGLTSASKQMTSLATAMTSLNTVSVPTKTIQSITAAMGSLSAIGKSSGLSSSITALNKLPELSTKLQSLNLTTFASQMKQVADAMRPLADQMSKVSAGFAAFPIRIQKIISGNAGLAASNGKASNSFGLLGKGITSALGKLTLWAYSVKRALGFIKGFFDESSGYIENLNLFRVTMGDATDESLRFAESANKALGIDTSEFIRNWGVFKQITSGFGIAADKADLMSKNLTQLGYDYASFFNTSVSTAMEKLQSGIVGQVRPLREFGISIDQATLQEVAFAHGIDQSVMSMTQAQKAQLRYVYIMEKSKNMMNDMAKTILTPANAMRVFEQQVTQLKRALGNLLLPILTVVLPYLQAFVEVLTEGIQRMAEFFGFELPKIDYSGFDGITNGAEDAEDSVNELKRSLAGFDELNVLSDAKKVETDFDLDLELPGYDFLSGIEERKNEIKKMMEDLIPTIGAVAAALAGLGVINLIKNLGVASGLISGLKKSLAGALVAVIEFQLVKGSFDNFLSNDGSIWDFVKGAIITAIGSGILYALFGTAGLVVGLGVSLVATLVSLGTAIGNGLDYNGLKANLMKVFAIAIGGIAGFAIGGPAGAAIGILVAAGLTFTLTSIAAHLSGQLQEGTLESTMSKLLGVVGLGLAGAGIGFLVGGPVGALVGFAIGATISFVVQEAAVDFGNWHSEVSKIVDGVDMFGEAISEATEQKLQPFLDSVQDFSTTLGSIEWAGLDRLITDSDVQTIQNKVSGIVGTITTELDSNKNSALATLEPLKAALGDEAFAEIIQNNQTYYDQLRQQVSSNEAQINDIFKEAAEQGRALRVDEWKSVNALTATLQDTGLQQITDSMVEYNAILNGLKDNAAHISLEQASEIMKNSQATMEAVIKDAQIQYSRVELESQRMLDVGAITSDQYAAIMQAAKDAKDSTISDAETQFSTIKNNAMSYLGDTARYLDTETWEIKNKWQIFCDDVATGWNQMWANAKTSLDSAGASIQGVVDRTVEGITGTFSTIGADIKSAFDESWSNITSFFTEAIPNWWNESIAPWFTAEKWKELGTNAVNGLLNGLSSILDSIKSWAGGIVDTVKNALGIHSPSTVFRDTIGKNLGLGIIEGLDSTYPALNRSISGMLDDVGSNIGSIQVPISYKNGLPPIRQYGASTYEQSSFVSSGASQEVVQQIGSKTATASNGQAADAFSVSLESFSMDIINAIYAANSQTAKAVESKDNNVYLDRQVISRAVYEDGQRLGKERGSSFVKRGV